MFKRISKKQAKQKLNEELAEEFQLQDTDSDESASESASASGSGSALEDSDLDDFEDAEDGGDMQTEYLGAGDEDTEDESDEEGLNLEDEPPMSVDEAVQVPIYLSSMSPEIRSCITCPNKKLKNNEMVEIHLKSSAHVRRYQRFCKLAQSTDTKSKDPREIVASLNKSVESAIVNPDGLTRRGVKRKLAREQIIKKRSIQKEIIKRKKLEKLEKKQEIERGKELKDAAKTLSPKKKRKLEDLSLEERPSKGKTSKTKNHKKADETTTSETNENGAVGSEKPHKKKKLKPVKATATADDNMSITGADEQKDPASVGSDHLRSEKMSKHAKKESLTQPSDKPRKKARYFEVDGDTSPAVTKLSKPKKAKKQKESKESEVAVGKGEGKKGKKKEQKGLQIFE